MNIHRIPNCIVKFSLLTAAFGVCTISFYCFHLLLEDNWHSNKKAEASKDEAKI